MKRLKDIAVVMVLVLALFFSMFFFINICKMALGLEPYSIKDLFAKSYEPHQVPCTGAVYLDGDVTVYPSDPPEDRAYILLTPDEYDAIMKHLEEAE